AAALHKKAARESNPTRLEDTTRRMLCGIAYLIIFSIHVLIAFLFSIFFFRYTEAELATDRVVGEGVDQPLSSSEGTHDGSGDSHSEGEESALDSDGDGLQAPIVSPLADSEDGGEAEAYIESATKNL